jgi:acyl dehydratase
MAAKIEGPLLGQIHEGEKLPELRYDVTASTIVLGAMAARDWRPMHHDKDFAVNRNGTKDIFLNTPNQAAWFERYLTDWTGPKGRLGKIQFRMKASVFPGDTMVFSGAVTGVDTDETGCGWATLEVRLTTDDAVVTDCTAKVAIPVDATDNPWKRTGDRWKP